MTLTNLHLTFRDGGTADAGDPYTGLDRFGRLVETLWKKGSDDQVRSKYGRNQVGGVVWRRNEEAHAQTPSVDTEDNYYGYDGLYQVKERQRGDLTGTAPDYTGVTNLQQEEDWTYDATGNWASYSNPSPAPTDAQTRTHNTANEIIEISATPGDVEPAYDPVGNMLTLPKEPGASTEQYDLVWDAWNRLVAVKNGGTTVASYTYDGLTRRQTKTNAAETRHYYYNADWRPVEERVDGASEPVDRQYTWGLRDRWDLLRRKRSVSGSLDETLYVLRDYLDPVAIVDETGSVVERYAYDAFGNVRFLAPDYTSKSGSDFDWNFLFHAEFRDKDTKLYDYGYRYYNTGLGRWLSKDLIGETAGLDLYCMVKNSPMETLDLVGLDPIRIGSAILLMPWKASTDLDPNKPDDPFPGIDKERQKKLKARTGVNATTVVRWNTVVKCGCGGRLWYLKDVQVIFYIVTRTRKPSGLIGANMLTVLKDELDHVFDWGEWISTTAKNILDKLRKQLPDHFTNFKTSDECFEAGIKRVDQELHNSAQHTSIATGDKYDNLELGARTPHLRPRRTKDKGLTPRDVFKPFPFNIEPP